jgi:hypothetical protein
MTNPLVASAADTGPSPWAGVWIAEDIEQIAAGVRGRAPVQQLVAQAVGA